MESARASDADLPPASAAELPREKKADLPQESRVELPRASEADIGLRGLDVGLLSPSLALPVYLHTVTTQLTEFENKKMFYKPSQK